MGGGAIKNTRRINKVEFEELSQELEALLSEFLGGEQVKTIPSYREKQDFGDIDILIDARLTREEIQELFKPNEIVKNGNIWSFDYKDVQVDIIQVKDGENFECTYTYLSYNVLGMLMGVIANNLGLKYGTFGLKYKYFKDDQPRGEHLLSSDPERIFKFLGFNYYNFLVGFSASEDIFKSVRYSKYFYKNWFALEELNHKNRTRNKKVKLYNDFLEYIKDLPMGFNPLERMGVSFEWIRSSFPQSRLQKFVSKVDYKYNQDHGISVKFNGCIVRMLTELEGKELGEFIAYFKKQFKSERLFRYFILYSSVEDIKRKILYHFAVWK